MAAFISVVVLKPGIYLVQFINKSIYIWQYEVYAFLDHCCLIRLSSWVLCCYGYWRWRHRHQFFSRCQCYFNSLVHNWSLLAFSTPVRSPHQSIQPSVLIGDGFRVPPGNSSYGNRAGFIAHPFLTLDGLFGRQKTTRDDAMAWQHFPRYWPFVQYRSGMCFFS